MKRLIEALKVMIEDACNGGFHSGGTAETDPRIVEARAAIAAAEEELKAIKLPE